MSAYEILKGGTANIPFATRGLDRALVNADSLPTVTGAQFAGTAIATTGISVVQQQDQTPANITGRYYIRITNTVTAAWADRGTGQVQISAVIGGITVTEEINFIVVAASTAMPFIDVN
jgi:hypothetical protein